MYVEPLYIYNNYASINGCITYYYKIKPINSLYASDTQLSDLISNLHKKVLDVNMAAEILIKPIRIDTQRIVNNYEELYKANGEPRLNKLKDVYMSDLKKQLNDRKLYRYEIYLMFCDGREELKSRKIFNIFSNDDDKLSKPMQQLCDIASAEIFKKLSTGLSAELLNYESITSLHNYLAIPADNYSDYYTKPEASYLKYDIKTKREVNFKELYSRVLIASEIKEVMSDGLVANTVINNIQLYNFPVDTIIKYDIEHTNKFKNRMSAKKETLRKSAKIYNNLSSRKDGQAIKAKELAGIGENVDESIEGSKLRWQMMFRMYSENEEMLNKRTEFLIRNFQGKKIVLTYELGEQESLSMHLFPFNTSFKHYVNTTDVLFFAHYNLFGGLYIGEEYEGVMISNTMPAQLPILINVNAPMEGTSKTSSTTSAFVGETGGGKSQLANNIMLVSMIFYGHIVLAVDPKGDRKNLVNTLNRYGDIANEIVIGGDKCEAGIFDPFLLNEGNDDKALAEAKNQIAQIARAVNPNLSISLAAIDAAYLDMKIKKEKGLIKHYTLTTLSEALTQYDKSLADPLNGLVSDPTAKLFFGNEDTDISKVFKLDKCLNLITFDDLPIYNPDDNKIEYHDDDIQHRIFALAIGKVADISNIFMRTNPGKAKTEQIDELKIFNSVPGGASVAINANLLARSMLTNLQFILQNWSDLPESIINNTGQFFVGSMKSQKEIDLILEHFSLDNNSTLKDVLRDRTKDEGVQVTKKYNFLYVDYNNRKALTKMKILPMFEKAFCTLKSKGE